MKRRNQKINFVNFNLANKRIIIIAFITLLFFITFFNYSEVIYLKNDQATLSQLRVTEEHPFYLEGQWVLAKDLKVGDTFKTIDGKTAKIKRIKLIEGSEPFYVYNRKIYKLYKSI
jgi:hypothetical protein